MIFLFKLARKIFRIVNSMFYYPFSRLLFFLNGCEIDARGLKVNGYMKVDVTRRGKVMIGNNLKVNSGDNHNVIGRQQKTILWVEGVLIIGNNVGLSSTAIICNHKIIIEDNVLIGGGVCIYDTDFHNLDSTMRMDIKNDKVSAKKEAVILKRNAFIGAHSTILKGVTVGENAIVGACSLVSKDIPANEIWAGNPAKFIKHIKHIKS